MTSRNAAGFKPATYSLGNRHNDSATASQSTTCDDATKNLALGLARILEDFPALTSLFGHGNPSWVMRNPGGVADHKIRVARRAAGTARLESGRLCILRVRSTTLLRPLSKSSSEERYAARPAHCRGPGRPAALYRQTGRDMIEPRSRFLIMVDASIRGIFKTRIHVAAFAGTRGLPESHHPLATVAPVLNSKTSSFRGPF